MKKILLLALLSFAMGASAQVQIPLQGRLVDLNGAPEVGNVDLRISLSDGTNLTTCELFNNTPLIDGSFSLVIGDQNGAQCGGRPIDISNALALEAFEVQVLVNPGNAEREFRFPLGDVPRAANANLLNGLSADEFASADPRRIVIVASGNSADDIASLNAAIAQANALSPNEANPVVIELGAGAFDFDGVHEIPQHVSLIGQGVQSTSISKSAFKVSGRIDVGGFHLDSRALPQAAELVKAAIFLNAPIGGTQQEVFAANLFDLSLTCIDGISIDGRDDAADRDEIRIRNVIIEATGSEGVFVTGRPASPASTYRMVSVAGAKIHMSGAAVNGAALTVVGHTYVGISDANITVDTLGKKALRLSNGASRVFASNIEVLSANTNAAVVVPGGDLFINASVVNGPIGTTARCLSTFNNAGGNALDENCQ